MSTDHQPGLLRRSGEMALLTVDSLFSVSTLVGFGAVPAILVAFVLGAGWWVVLAALGVVATIGGCFARIQFDKNWVPITPAVLEQNDLGGLVLYLNMVVAGGAILGATLSLVSPAVAVVVAVGAPALDADRAVSDKLSPAAEAASALTGVLGRRADVADVLQQVAQQARLGDVVRMGRPTQ